MRAEAPLLLRDRVRDVLIEAGTWVPRIDLNGLTGCAPALDDALADLVIDGVVEHRQAVGYRVKGSDLVRKALRQLVRNPANNRAVVARQVKRQFSIGIAERRAGIGIVSYELELPPAADDDAALNQAIALTNFWNANMELKDVGRSL